MDFILNGKTIYVSYISSNNKKTFIDNLKNKTVQKYPNYNIIKFQENTVTLYFPDYIEITEYTSTRISENIFYINWNETATMVFISMFLNYKDKTINIFNFNTTSGNVTFSSGKYTVLDENTVIEEQTENIEEKLIENKISDEVVSEDNKFNETKKSNSNELDYIEDNMKNIIE